MGRLWHPDREIIRREHEEGLESEHPRMPLGQRCRPPARDASQAAEFGSSRGRRGRRVRLDLDESDAAAVG